MWIPGDAACEKGLPAVENGRQPEIHRIASGGGC